MNAKLKNGNRVCVNPMQKNPGWKDGKILEVDKNSGLVRVADQYNDEKYEYRVHRKIEEELYTTGFEQKFIVSAIKEYEQHCDKK